ncbi:MAG: epoxyqueuosine reductase QueH [Candidatus Stahlbacteria bacterium]|nr:epoxyqueuosine reductase QueH [Candidatus Stahlbacteria bacterium]
MCTIQKIVLHICCAPCATEVVERLKNQEYGVVGVFYNPNIYPQEEYTKRLNTLKKLVAKINFQLLVGPYNADKWKKQIEETKEVQLEVEPPQKEPEGGERCKICYRMRLNYTAEIAKAHGYKIFTTTLTISPHKSAEIINYIGKEVGERHKLEFKEFDFKKQNGFKQSILLSKKYELYRQSYCGCKYSTKLNK